MTADFYNDLAPYFHLIFQDWNASIERQGKLLDAIIRAEWGGSVQRILDAAAGIGTQALALAARGYSVTASDISRTAVTRAGEEAAARGLSVPVVQADLRSLSAAHGAYDVVLACDNALPHLLSDEDLLLALRECYRCTVPGGGCLFSVRDYAAETRSGREFRPYGVREQEGIRTVLFQVWDWQGEHYDLSFYIVEDDPGGDCRTFVTRSRYYAVTTDRLLELIREAGYDTARRIDGAFFQPVLVATRPPGS